MKVTSSAFQDHQAIPTQYTGEGVDHSPPLTIQQIPAGTVTLAIIMDDPDAPMGTFTHWVAWNLPPTEELDEGASLPLQGKTDFGKIGYNGPLPPPGSPHHYFFKIYALDTSLDLPEGCDKPTLERNMQGHILDQAELIGTYQR